MPRAFKSRAEELAHARRELSKWEKSLELGHGRTHALHFWRERIRVLERKVK